MAKVSKIQGSDVSAVAAIVKGAKKSTKGVPRITDKVLAMDEAGKQAWFAEKCAALSPETQAEIQARMAAGRVAKVGKVGKVIDFTALFAGKSLAVLTVAKAALDAALADTAVREEAELNDKIAILTQQKEALLSSRRSTVVV